MKPIIRFEQVSKSFTLQKNQPKTIQESLVNFGRAKRSAQVLHALRDVSFDIEAGQCLGIVGRNGSGKSTTLKLVTRILRPDKGRILVGGRVSALLELGAGFHPDLTGRENIFLNGAVLGLSHAETTHAFDSIVAFAELEAFIDMPVKHYSSGMYMRLGFSVAIHVRPEILIVDEVLSVGDQAFQAKCIERIYEMKRQGVTILMVSHHLDTLRKLCTQLLWIQDGHVRHYGDTTDVASRYNQYMNEKLGIGLHDVGGSFKRWGNGEVAITAVRFLDQHGQAQTQFLTGERITVEIAYHAYKPVPNPEFGLAFYHQDGTHINGPNSRAGGLQTGTIEGAGIVRYEIEALPFLPSRYMVTVAIHDSRFSLAYDYHEHAYSFEVVPGGTEEMHGLIELPASWAWQPAQIPTR